MKQNVVGIFKILLVSYALTAILLSIVAFLMYKMNLTLNNISLVYYVICGIAAFAGGFLIGKIRKSKRLLWGVLVGFLYVVILTIAALAINRNGDINMAKMLIRGAVCIFFGAFGGIFS